MAATPTPEVGISDIHIAAFLLATGHSLVRTEEGTPGRVEFVFRNVGPAEVRKYFDSTTKIEPRLLLNALKDLKGMLRGGVR